jgi:hypothetical protein
MIIARLGKHRLHRKPFGSAQCSTTTVIRASGKSRLRSDDLDSTVALAVDDYITIGRHAGNFHWSSLFDGKFT